MFSITNSYGQILRDSITTTFNPTSNVDSFSVNISYKVELTSSAPVYGVTLTCMLPSSVVFQETDSISSNPLKGYSYNPSTRIVTFNLGDYDTTKTNNGVTLKVKFRDTTQCSTSATFIAEIQNADSSFTSTPVTVTLSDIQPNWTINYTPQGNDPPDFYYYNNLPFSQASRANASPYIQFNNGHCSECNQDTILYEFVVNHDSKVYTFLKDAYVNLHFNRGVTILGAFINKDSAISGAHPISGTILNTGFPSINGISVVDVGGDLLTTNDRPYFIKIVVPDSLFNQQICLIDTLFGKKYCDNTNYFSAGPTRCAVIYTPLPDTGIIISPHRFTFIATSDACNNTDSVYRGWYYNKHNTDCIYNCLDETEYFPIKPTLKIKVPTVVKLENIILPLMLNENDTVVLSGKYYCDNSYHNFPPLTYTSTSFSGKNISVNEIGNVCSDGNLYISEYTFTTNFSIIDYNYKSLGGIKFSTLPKNWNNNTDVTEGQYYFIDTLFDDSIYKTRPNITYEFIKVIPKLSQILIGNKIACDKKNPCYAVGDTIEYITNIQSYSLSTSDFVGGKIVNMLPIGIKHIPGSDTLSMLSHTSIADASYLEENLCHNNDVTVIDSTFYPISIIEKENLSSMVKWDLPTIPYVCNNWGDVYTLKFKALVTNNAIYNKNIDSAYLIDAFGNVIKNFGYYYSKNGSHVDYENLRFDTINVCQRTAEFSPYKEVSLNGIEWTKETKILPIGSTVYYRIKIKNDGNIPISNVKVVDILPGINDSTVTVSCLPRGSNVNAYLISALEAPTGVTIKYNTSSNPPRKDDLHLVGTDGACEDTSPWITNIDELDIQTLRSFMIDYGNVILMPDDSLIYKYAVQIPPGVNTGDSAINSFGATYQNVYSEYISLGSESYTKVKVDSIRCACIGNFVWNDINNNGLQDIGEPGVNGALLTLYNDSTNEIVDVPHTSTDSSIGYPGYYLFCNIPAGKYYITISPPINYQVAPYVTSPDAINNDADPALQRTKTFTVICNNQKNNTIDIGLVPYSDCNNCEKRNNIKTKALDPGPPSEPITNSGPEF